MRTVKKPRDSIAVKIIFIMMIAPAIACALGFVLSLLFACAIAPGMQCSVPAMNTPIVALLYSGFLMCITGPVGAVLIFFLKIFGK
ncbi:hypothetical protein SAMN05428948_0998 [Massilia sp. CF038]|nr:hypothetical protein SAMN05428948_0998 [Massilia sp. CF038]